MSRFTYFFSILLISLFFFLVFQLSFEFSTQEESKKQNYSNIENVRFIHYLDENVAIEEIRS
ncbi:MAG TPA: hypothetical protein VFY77_07195, partial [Nitrososphaeraceae archaeon]|nr:hypothetical protein [Nitrososphaeraceae archaeon]